jgi:hypothetical protein
MTDTTATALDDHWHELVTAALLGTDRRQPPVSPLQPIADVVDDTVAADDAARMLATVAAVAAARRAAFVALPPASMLQPPSGERRPINTPAASATWQAIVDDWPVLEDEWLLTLIDAGQRLAPDVLVAALARHRNDPVRRARVALAGGPVAAWVVEHVPAFDATPRTVSAEAVTSLPELAIPPDLAELLGADAHTFVSRLMAGFELAAFGPAHRPVLTNLVARCRPAVLLDTATALEHHGTGLALALADLARLRNRMLDELQNGLRWPVSRRPARRRGA